jgi:filamentous hemagglutinin family protein
MRTVTTALRHILVSALTAALAVGPVATRAFAGTTPAGPQQRPGGNQPMGIVVPDGPNSWRITAPNGAIIHFSNLDIHAGETVTFVQPGANSRVLNRVFSKAPTEIDGTLSANGHVYIVNPAGVVFGSGAQVNANGIHAAAGRMSDRDFERGDLEGLTPEQQARAVDHYTGLRGRVRNEADITASAVSLVGAQVTNSGKITASVNSDTGTGGWIIMAAGRDVLIGHDTHGNGILLRVEGAADAVFKQNARGVENTGTGQLVANESATDGDAGGRVTLGAGDLYGTAIFSSGAIKARQLALSADNKGDVALGGSVDTDLLTARFAGNTTGVMHGAGAPGAAPTTITANEVDLVATGDHGRVQVGDGLAFRGSDPVAQGPATVTVTQKANLATSDLAGLDIGTNHAATDLKLNSTGGSLAVDDRGLVNGTQLDLAARNFVDVRGPADLDVESLKINSQTTFSAADLIARGVDGINATTNIAMVTQVPTAADPGAAALISAHTGTLTVTGDITSSAGGKLSLEAKNVFLGTFDDRGARGGTIDVSGGTRPGVSIGFTDAAGVQQTDRVTLNGINADGRRTNEDAKLVAGGDVVVNANQDIAIHGNISTHGDAGKNGAANLPGGSVRIATSGELIVGGISTGGADAPTGAAPEQGSISLSAIHIIDTGNLDTRGGTNGNADGSRDRSIEIAGIFDVGADQLGIFGGDITIHGPVRRGTTSATDITPRPAALAVSSSGATTFDGTVSLEALRVQSKGGSVLFGGDVVATKSFGVSTSGAGALTVGTVDGVTGPITVTSQAVSFLAQGPQVNGKPGTTSSLAVDPDIHFNLLDVDTNPDPKVDAFQRGSFSFDQDAAIDQATTDALFTPGRFKVTGTKPVDPNADPNAPAPVPTPDVRDGLSLEQVTLSSLGSVSLGTSARDALRGSALTITGREFSSVDTATGNPGALDLQSLTVTTDNALAVNFDVTAAQDITLHAGILGGSDSRDLTLSSRLAADSITLTAGTGSTGATGAAVNFASGAQLRASDGTKAKTVVISQDADLATGSLPDVDIFGTGANPLDYQLESRSGTVTLTDTDAARAKIDGTALTLTGAVGVDLGTHDLSLASLTASSAGDLTVSANVKTNGDNGDDVAGTKGQIVLKAGTGGSGDLHVDSLLTADDIELFAGKGSGTSVVDLQSNAHFESASSAHAAPTRFLLQQDTAIGEDSGTPVPDAALFGGGTIDGLKGMQLALNSLLSTVHIQNPETVKGTALEMTGTTVTVDGSLDVASLETHGNTILLGGVTANNGADGDIAFHGGTVTLSGDPNTAPLQSLHASGDLTADGAITRSTKGDLELSADHALSVLDVTTAHTGNKLSLTGLDSVKAGKLDASAGDANFNGGAIKVTSNGAVDLGGIDSSGADGSAQTSKDPAGTGSNGGEIQVTGSKITVGLVTSAGGAGGALDASRTGFTSQGGNGANITLDAHGGEIGLKGSVFADAGDGKSTDSATAAAKMNGQFGNVELDGDVKLLASNEAGGDTNFIHGNDVAIHGAVTPGSLPDDPNVPDVTTPIDPSFTGLQVVADGKLVIDGDITTGTLDLEEREGNLALGTASDPKQVNADEIRLAASNGAGTRNDEPPAEVDLTNVRFAGSNGTGPVTKFTLEQDASIGVSGGGTAVPNVHIFDGTGGRAVPFTLGLVSQDGDIVLDAADVANVNGTNLLLAANGRAGQDPALQPIRINGADLIVPSLTLGTSLGVAGSVVGGDTSIERDLVAGTSTSVEFGLEGLRSNGNLHVSGEATVLGGVNFVGADSQTFKVDGQFLELNASVEKATAGTLTIDSQRIDLTGAGQQSIASDHGSLVITSPLVKATGALSLRGVSSGTDAAAVTVQGTKDGLALETQDGSLVISATSEPTDGSSTGFGPGTYQLDGGVRATGGDLTLTGNALLSAGLPSYQFEARRDDQGVGGQLTMTGIKSADGDVFLVAEGPAPTVDIPEPSAIHLKGDFNVSKGLFVDGRGNTIEVAGDTTIEAQENVELNSGVVGANKFDVRSHEDVVLYDDVAMTDGQVNLAGDTGVLFVSAEDVEQSIQAGSISLGNGAANAPKGRGSLLRDGSLELNALKGNVSMARGQRLIVNGALDVSAAGGVTLSDTAALGVNVRSTSFDVYGAATIVSNSIATSARPHVFGSGSATFAVPTRTEVSSNVPSDNVLVRAISPNGAKLSFTSPSDDDGLIGPPFPLPPDFVGFDPTFPAVTGAAIFDFARQIPEQNPTAAITRPHASAIDLAAAVRVRPLWAEELLAYLEQRSVEPPDATGRVPDAELLPPVGARPGDSLEASDARLRSAAVEGSVAAYRNLFRANLHRDPETGVIDGPSDAGEIRSAFQAPVDALRREHSGRAVSAAEVAKLVDTDAKFAAASRYREQLGTLLDLGQRALTPDQAPRFRALVLAEVTPYGLSPKDFSELFPNE